jgi:hypothetical protein
LVRWKWKGDGKRTQLLVGLLEAGAGDNGLLQLLGLGDILLEGLEPAITGGLGVGSEGVLGAVQTEGDFLGLGSSEVLNFRLGRISQVEVKVGAPTKFRAPWGLSFCSASLTKYRRPLPVSLDQAAVWAV